MDIKLTRQAIEQQVLDVVAEILQVERAGLRLDTDIRRDLKADSMAILTLTIELDAVFDMSFDESRLPELSTIGDIIDYISATAGAQ